MPDHLTKVCGDGRNRKGNNMVAEIRQYFFWMSNVHVNIMCALSLFYFVVA